MFVSDQFGLDNNDQHYEKDANEWETVFIEDNNLEYNNFY